jgi:polyisoprenyl-phosphate glycosyltransferase
LHLPIEPAASLPFSLVPRDYVPHVCVVVPAHNEEDALEQLYVRLERVLDELAVPWSILFVNDGSDDGTTAVLESLYARDERVSYLVLSRNFGHQAALGAGLDRADADVVITMDADLQHPPELIGVLLDAWRRGYDIVHTRKTATEEQSGARSLVTRVAYAAIKRVSQVNIIPQASDFRLLDREALEAVRRLPERGRLYRGLTPWIGFRQAVVPYRAAARTNGSSRYGLRQLMQLFARSFFDFSSAPLHLAFVLGSATLALCSGYLLFVLGAYVLGNPMPRGFAPLVFAIIFLGSVNLTFTGILGVYQARIYDEVRGRPAYILGRVREHAQARAAAPEAGWASPTLGQKLVDLQSVQQQRRS